MKTAKTMQTIITAIAAKHGLDLSASEAHLKLEQDCYMPLVIEKVGLNLISVAHYFRQNGDTIADPDVVFFMGYLEWVPIEIQQSFGYQQVAKVKDDGSAISHLNVRAQADLASFCRMWGKNIKEQQWLEQGRVPSKEVI
jgi:hypothetical protein